MEYKCKPWLKGGEDGDEKRGESCFRHANNDTSVIGVLSLKGVDSVLSSPLPFNSRFLLPVLYDIPKDYARKLSTLNIGSLNEST